MTYKSTPYYKDTVWDDTHLRNIPGAESIGRYPSPEIIANDGTTAAGNAVHFQGGHGTVPSYTDLDSTGSYTVEFWVKPDEVDNNTYFYFRQGFIEMRIQWADLIYKIAGSWEVYVTDALVAGSTQHVVLAVSWDGSQSLADVYVNGQLVQSDTISGYQLGSVTSDVYIASDASGNNPHHGIIDRMITYNKKLTSSQVTERYNGGQGTTALPTGITEATDVTMLLEFDEGTGSTVDNSCTLGAGHDCTLSGTYAWEQGLVGIPSGSIGVIAQAFTSGEVREIWRILQTPHAWKEGSTVYLHAHWFTPATTGDVVWKAEILKVKRGSTIGNTTILTETVTVDSTANTSVMTNVPSAGIDMTGYGISDIVLIRFYRDGTDSADTCTDKAYLTDLDVHVELNTPGSREVAAK